MPTYEYECKKCGIVEVFQGITEKKLKKCPTCKGPVKRLLGAGAGIIFKGSGFYQTDYRSDSYKSGSKSDSSHAGSEATKSKTETKPPASAAGATKTDAGKGSSDKAK